MKKRIYLITGNDEWLTHLIIEKLSPTYSVVLIKIKSNSFNLIKILKLVVLFGFIDFIKILLIQLNKKKYKIVNIKKNNLDNFLRKVKKDKIFLVNLPFKISENFKNIYNCHPSLLPNYRGLLPIVRNLFDIFVNNKKILTGVTIHKINKKFDSGKIIWNKSINLSQKKKITFKSIYEDFYLSFSEGIDKVYNIKKIKYKKIIKYKIQKKNISFYEIFKLKFKI